MDDVSERHAAYRAGLCIDCKTVPYSAGRPRCETCHQKHIRPTTPEPWLRHHTTDGDR